MAVGEPGASPERGTRSGRPFHGRMGARDNRRAMPREGEAERASPPEQPRPGQISALLAELVRVPEASAASGWERALKPGTVVGRYELVREVGRGGFGVVYEARDRELRRTVAFKAIRPGHGPQLAEEALLREAEAAALCSHPNIVTLHDLGRSEHGPYLVLEFLRGETLAARLGRGSFGLEEALRIGTEVAKGLAHAHAHGVVHRDLTPRNVFLCDDGQVKVLDLGLARAFGRRIAEGGTPGYMAPEQRRGAPEDERTDVYAMGVILSQMLGGEPAGGGEGGHARSVPQGAPLAVRSLLVRMLDPDPVRRPRDAAEVLAALMAPSAALPAPTGAAREARTPRDPVPRPVTLAVLPLTNLSGDESQEYFSDGITEEITGKLSRLRDMAVAARTSVERFKRTAIGARDIGVELGVDYLVEGSVRRAGDRIRVRASLVRAADGIQLWSDDIDAFMDDIFAVQERVATRIVESLGLRLGPDETRSLGRWGTRNAQAYDEYLRGQALEQRFHDASQLLAAVAHFQRALDLDPDYAPALAGLAGAEAQTYRNVDSDPGRLARAESLVKRALVIDARLTRARMAKGELRAVRFDYAGAAEIFRAIVSDEPRNYFAWDLLCWCLGYCTPPRATEAEEAARRALEINPDYAEPYYHLARVLVAQGRIADAERALAELEERVPSSSLSESGRFWLLLGSGRPGDALASLESEVALTRSNLKPAWAAAALAQAGDHERALEQLEAALAQGYRDVDDLRRSPYLAPLRRDPRFAQLLASYRLAT